MPRFNQYIKKVEHNGITFDSQEECEYYKLLLKRYENEEIDYLRTHKSFELVPAYELNGKLIKAINYEADFEFYDRTLNRSRAIDVKGFADDVFKLKKKLFDYYYGHKFPLGLEVMKYAKSTGWVNYDEYKKARASYKKRLVAEKNSYKKQLEEIDKQAIRDTKLLERYKALTEKKKLYKLTKSELERYNQLEQYFQDKIIKVD
ncbi:MAG: DUF1064 domain-containing protein [Bacteroidales bacterium]|nr:DUF1064 domain-containing protein [Bacteroidales bacterium]